MWIDVELLREMVAKDTPQGMLDRVISEYGRRLSARGVEGTQEALAGLTEDVEMEVYVLAKKLSEALALSEGAQGDGANHLA